MNIVPKISDVDCDNIGNISIYLLKNDKLEIQLMDEDLEKSFLNVSKLVDNFSHLKYIVLHMPFSIVNICYIYSNFEVRKQFIRLILNSIRLSLHRNIEIDILFHVGMRTGEFVGLGGIEFLNYIINIVEGTKVGFLVENAIINLSKGDNEQDTIVTIFKSINSEKLKFCFDLCHWQSSEYVWNSPIDLDSSLLANLKNVHFSMTLNRDGYKNKSETHSREHTSMRACLNDLKYMKEKGIDLQSVNLITEISEIDYETRPRMRKELSYLWGIALKS